MIFGEIDSFLSIYERFRKLFKINLKPSISERFFYVFEVHGIHRNQIPRIFPGYLTVYDVQSNELLMPKLSEDLLNLVSEFFGVRREWLECVDDQVYKFHDFYKYPEEFEIFLKSNLNNSGWSQGYVLIDEESRHGKNALFVLKVPIFELENEHIYKYVILDNWDFSYWKSRVFLVCCVAIASKLNVNVRYSNIKNQELKKLFYSDSFFTCKDGGFIGRFDLGGYPDDMAVYPDKLLDGLPPGENNQDWIDALDLWLRLHEKGLMQHSEVNYSPERFLLKRNEVSR